MLCESGAIIHDERSERKRAGFNLMDGSLDPTD